LTTHRAAEHKQLRHRLDCRQPRWHRHFPQVPLARKLCVPIFRWVCPVGLCCLKGGVKTAMDFTKTSLALVTPSQSDLEFWSRRVFCIERPYANSRLLEVIGWAAQRVPSRPVAPTRVKAARLQSVSSLGENLPSIGRLGERLAVVSTVKVVSFMEQAARRCRRVAELQTARCTCPYSDRLHRRSAAAWSFRYWS